MSRSNRRNRELKLEVLDDRITPQISPTNSSAAFASPTDSSRSPDPVTIVVEDTAGNPITGLSNSDFTLTLLGVWNTGSIGPVSESTTPGTYTADFTGAKAGTDTLTIQVDGTQLDSQPTVAVTAGPVYSATATASFDSVIDVNGNTDTLTLVLADAAGNPINGLMNSDFNLALSGGTSAGTLGQVSETLTPGTYTADFTGTAAGSTDILTVQVDGTQLLSQPNVTVTVGAVDAGTSTADFASSTDVSGSVDTLTIVLFDTAGNPITGLSSSDFSLALSGGTSTGWLIGPVTETTIPGTYTTDITGVVPGTADTLTIQVGGTQLDSQPTVTITNGALDPTVSTASFTSSTDASGTADTLTIVLSDTAGNPITGLSNSDFSLALSGGTSTGSFGLVTETGTPGTYTAAFTGAKAGTAETVTVQVDGVLLASPPTVRVKPGAAGVGTTVTLPAESLTAGQSEVITIVAKDAAGNAITDLTTSNFSFDLVGGSNGGFGQVTETSTSGTYTVVFTGIVAGAASPLQTNIDGVLLNEAPTIQVKAGALSTTTSSASFATAQVASGTATTLTIVLEDAEGNPIGPNRAIKIKITFGSGTSTGTLGAVTAAGGSGGGNRIGGGSGDGGGSGGGGTYTVSFTGAVAGTARNLRITVDGQLLAARPIIEVTPGAVSGTKSKVTVAAASLKAGKTEVVTIKVKDAAGNAIPDLLAADFSFALSGGTSLASFGTVTPTSTPGTYHMVMTGVTAGTAAELMVEVNGVTITTQPKVTVHS